MEYTYDAWGNILSCTGTRANTIGKTNPIRYRGYVYDEETGLYYLGSRYYNPEWGRFLNADGYVSTGQGFIGNNMFAYCLNNPVSMADEDGLRAVYYADDMLGGGYVIVSPAPIRDVSDEVDRALDRQVEIYQQKAKQYNVFNYSEKFEDFIVTVTDGGDWDIKYGDPWDRTIQTEYPGDGATVVYHGETLVLEELGNYTYGYIGKAYGFSDGMLILGSWANDLKKHLEIPNFTGNEEHDRIYIWKGINAYRQRY